ncbi:hypothetical protein PIB30_070451 [Stylosanthes scabra]|uniref:Uncharacterized protein n=1 Tax=Stylosanthes scabra TaxID=79078 RepID=A0ABU6ZM62_9FABA|nr:hypothetical protein [Stylosanthes scabra]
MTVFGGDLYEEEEDSRSLSRCLTKVGVSSGFVKVSATCSKVDKLSQKTVGGMVHDCRSSKRRFWIHCTSVNTAARALYSASVELRLTVGCFEDFHDTKFEPKNTQYPEVDFRSSRSLAQSESAKRQHGIDTQRTSTHQVTSKRGSGVIQGPIHARTAFRPRLGVGFHHSPRLGVAGKPKTKSEPSSSMVWAPQSHYDRARSTLGHEPNVDQAQHHAKLKSQLGLGVVQSDTPSPRSDP